MADSNRARAQRQVDIQELETVRNGIEASQGESGTQITKLRQEVSEISHHNDFVENVLGKEVASTVVESMNSFLQTANSASNVQKVAGLLDTTGPQESMSESLQKLPKEIFLLGMPVIALLIYIGGQQLFCVLFAGLIAYLANMYLNFAQVKNRDNIKREVILQVESSSRTTAEYLANKATEIQQIRTGAVVKVTEIHRNTITEKLRALQAMQAAEIECNMTLAKIREEGSTTRMESQNETKKKLAAIQAEQEKIKAELLKQTEIEVQKLKLQQTQIEEENVRAIKKIETESMMAIQKLKDDSHQRQIQHESSLAAAQRESERKLREAEIKKDMETKLKEINAKKDTELKKIEAEIAAAREQTRQIEIQEKEKTEREKCRIQ